MERGRWVGLRFVHACAGRPVVRIVVVVVAAVVVGAAVVVAAVVVVGGIVVAVATVIGLNELVYIYAWMNPRFV